MSNPVKKVSPEVHARAMRLVLEHEGEVDTGKRAGVPPETAHRLKALEHENQKLHQMNEILPKASAYFAQAELDRPFRK